jgi:hypothetical protein
MPLLFVMMKVYGAAPTHIKKVADFIQQNFCRIIILVVCGLLTGFGRIDSLSIIMFVPKALVTTATRLR